MKIIQASSFTRTSSWDALDIANIEGASIRLHWADKPYIWHKNDGDEVFVVLDGQVDMHFRENGVERQVLLSVGDVCYLSQGEEHVANPLNGVARILVVERQGSI